MDVWIRQLNTWQKASDAMRDAYANYKLYKLSLNCHTEEPYITKQYIVYRPNNDPYLPTYVARIDEIEPSIINKNQDRIGTGTNLKVKEHLHDQLLTSIPIIDMQDIKTFITTTTTSAPQSHASWIAASNYQAWAYRDFVYDKHHFTKKSYMSADTSHLVFNESTLTNQIIIIELPDLPPNIVFNISRNPNNSIFYEKNDFNRTRVRICDNEFARAKYLGFYNRLTMQERLFPLCQWNER